MNQIIITSTTILLWKRFYKKYVSTVKKLNYLYQNSLPHRLINRFWEKIKICFRYSFFGRITETRQTNPEILDNSRGVQYLFGFYERRKSKIIKSFEASSTTDLVKDTKKDLYFFPVKVISTIVIIAIITDVFLSIVLQRTVNLWGWLIRGLLFFVAFSGLFCKADWPTVKRNSIFLRKIRID